MSEMNEPGTLAVLEIAFALEPSGISSDGKVDILAARFGEVAQDVFCLDTRFGRRVLQNS